MTPEPNPSLVVLTFAERIVTVYARLDRDGDQVPSIQRSTKSSFSLPSE